MGSDEESVWLQRPIMLAWPQVWNCPLLFISVFALSESIWMALTPFNNTCKQPRSLIGLFPTTTSSTNPVPCSLFVSCFCDLFEAGERDLSDFGMTPLFQTMDGPCENIYRFKYSSFFRFADDRRHGLCRVFPRVSRRWQRSGIFSVESHWVYWDGWRG